MPDGWLTRLRRRSISVGAVGIGALGLTVLAPLWVPLVALADVGRRRWRLPDVRLGAFATAWCWLEVIGVGRAVGLWATGRSHDLAAHYRLQRWWVHTLMAALHRTTGVQVTAAGTDLLAPGPTVMLCRHASLADSLVSAWVISDLAGMNPHYVLKRELLGVPNLDIVGNRLPNVFVDRQAPDAAPELARIRQAAARLGQDDVMVIFPEGTRANAHKRQRALARIAERDPQRAERLGALTQLLPVRLAGSAAIVDARPDADVLLAWHTGFEGMDSVAGIRQALAGPPRRVSFAVERIPAADVPRGERFGPWLDQHWLTLDRRVASAIDGGRT